MPYPLDSFLQFTVIELVIFLIIVVPTAYAMIAGAPFLPTEMAQVDRMLKAAKPKKGSVLYDLGSGDGRLVHKAAQNYGAKAIGYEYSPLVWLWARFLALFWWRSDAQLRYGNFWKQDISDADIIVCYLLPHSMKKMEEELLPQLKKGTLIVSHAFAFPNMKVMKKLPRSKELGIGPVRIYKTT